MVLVLCTSPDTAFIFLPSSMKISQRVSKLLSRHDFQGKYFSRNVGEVMVLVISSSPDNAIYLYQIL